MGLTKKGIAIQRAHQSTSYEVHNSEENAHRTSDGGVTVWQWWLDAEHIGAFEQEVYASRLNFNIVLLPWRSLDNQITDGTDVWNKRSGSSQCIHSELERHCLFGYLLMGDRVCTFKVGAYTAERGKLGPVSFRLARSGESFTSLRQIKVLHDSMDIEYNWAQAQTGPTAWSPEYSSPDFGECCDINYISNCQDNFAHERVRW